METAINYLLKEDIYTQMRGANWKIAKTENTARQENFILHDVLLVYKSIFCMLRKCRFCMSAIHYPYPKCRDLLTLSIQRTKSSAGINLNAPNDGGIE